MLSQALYIPCIPRGLSPSVRYVALGEHQTTSHISVSREEPIWTWTLEVAEGVAAPCLSLHRLLQSWEHSLSASFLFLQPIVRKFLYEPLCIPVTLTHWFKFCLLSLLTFPYGNPSYISKAMICLLFLPLKSSLFETKYRFPPDYFSCWSNFV